MPFEAVNLLRAAVAADERELAREPRTTVTASVWLSIQRGRFTGRFDRRRADVRRRAAGSRLQVEVCASGPSTRAPMNAIVRPSGDNADGPTGPRGAAISVKRPSMMSIA